MDKQKQIEEMGRVLSTVKKCDAFTTSNCIKRKCEYPHYSGVTCIAEHQAEALYNAGYCKLPEGSEIVDKKVLEMFQKDEERYREKAKFYYEKCKSYGIENFYDPELEYVDD